MENTWEEITEETAPGKDDMDLSWMIPFWTSFTDCVIELNSLHIITNIRHKAGSDPKMSGIMDVPLVDIASWRDRDLVENNLNQLKTGTVDFVHFQFLLKIGRYYRWTLIPLYKDGIYNGCRGVAVDVTDNTKKEITLNWQRAVIERGRDFVLIFDMKGNVLYTNPGAYKMTGYNPESGTPPPELIYSPEHYNTVYGEGLDAVKKDGFWIGRGEIVREDGTHIPIEHTMFSITNEQGDIILYATVIRDITVFLEHEKEIEEARLNAEAANIAKSDFLSRMSHEIRTPMNAIIGMINIGLRTDDIEKKEYCLTQAESAANHLLGIINDVLDMSKIEADKLELLYSEFNFKNVLKKVVNMANIRAEEKSIELSVKISEDVPVFIFCDEMRLVQVITNLLTNAIKFTPEKGTVTLSVDKTVESDNNIGIRVEVSDTGIGISQEQQKRLFTSFSQANAGVASQFGGTGLGLAISKSIIAMMGGSIWVESELGEGARFIFTLDLEKIKGEQNGSIKRPDVNKEGDTSVPSYDFSDYNVLIAEDIEINRVIMSAILEETGICIYYAETGKKAVSMVSERTVMYDIILMDINMPEMDGYEATRQIRALEFEEAKKVPIIAMTANVFKEDIKRCIEAGMNDHTGKPVDTKELLEKLNRYLLTQV